MGKMREPVDYPRPSLPVTLTAETGVSASGSARGSIFTFVTIAYDLIWP